jgi:hypothetical protein
MEKEITVIIHAVQQSIINNPPPLGKRDAVYSEARKTKPLTGYCYVATQAVWCLLGGLGSDYRPHVIANDGVDTHWYLMDSAGSIIDPTASQFEQRIPYEEGRMGLGKMCMHLRNANDTLRLYKLGIFIPDKKTKHVIQQIEFAEFVTN